MNDPRLEDRLRRALQATADRIEPEHGFDELKEKVMDARRVTTPQRWVLGSLAAAVVLVVVLLAVSGGGEEPSDVATGSSTTVPESTTTEPPSSTPTPSSTTVPPAFVAVDGVVFPDPRTSQRFEDPLTVATRFAIDVAGFEDPDVGEFQQGDSRSGEVPITTRPNGPVTTVLVRQLDDDTWFVIGAVTDDITVDTPEARAAVDNPFELSGTGLAFEGTINYTVRSLAGDDLAEGFVTASGTPPAGPYSERVVVRGLVDKTPAVLMMRTFSAENGELERVTALPFLLDASPCGDAEETPGAGERSVFFICDETADTAVARNRTVPSSQPLAAILDELFAGPTDAERAAGLSSAFGTATADAVLGVRLVDGEAIVDLDGDVIRANVANASASSLAFVLSANSTVFQFESVQLVEYQFDGSCQDFADYFQFSDCRYQRGELS